MKLTRKICLFPPKWALSMANYSSSIHHLGILQHSVKRDPNSVRLGVFKTYGDELRLMGVNISIYNEKTSRLFCFSSKIVLSILFSPPPSPPSFADSVRRSFAYAYVWWRPDSNYYQSALGGLCKAESGWFQKAALSNSLRRGWKGEREKKGKRGHKKWEGQG